MCVCVCVSFLRLYIVLKHSSLQRLHCAGSRSCRHHCGDNQRCSPLSLYTSIRLARSDRFLKKHHKEHHAQGPGKVWFAKVNRTPVHLFTRNSCIVI